MESNETHTIRSETIRALEPAEYGLRRPIIPAIRWGAVLAGVAVGVSVQLALTLLGIATGLSTVEVTQGDNLGTGSLLWAALSMLIAAFVGGYVAARMSGLKRKTDGVLHGAVSWAVTTILFAALATTAGGSLVSGVFSTMAQSARAGNESPIIAMMRTQGVQLDADSMRQFVQSVQGGQREQAVRILGARAGMDDARASAIVDQALILTGSPEAASQQGRAATEGAMRRAGTAAWVVFLAVALALALGVSGGALGAAGSRRISWAGSAQ